MVENTNEQILTELFAGMGKDELLELADSTMTSMVGKVFRDILAEKGKENPDQELIMRLTKEKKELLEEQRRILFSSDEETQRSCIRKYSPILRAMVSKSE